MPVQPLAMVSTIGHPCPVLSTGLIIDTNDRSDTVELTADIVSAYVSKNSIRPDELANLIGEVHRALSQTPQQGSAEPAQKPQEPAVSVRSSVKPDYLEDGKKFKSLRRHLQNEHGMTPNEYRAKWGLKSDYPMTAPAYSEARSQMAKSLG